jgi:hypothetical protein
MSTWCWRSTVGFQGLHCRMCVVLKMNTRLLATSCDLTRSYSYASRPLQYPGRSADASVCSRDCISFAESALGRIQIRVYRLRAFRSLHCTQFRTLDSDFGKSTRKIV